MPVSGANTKPSGSGGTAIASDVSFTPAGNIQSITVQAGMQELDDEKVNKKQTIRENPGAFVPAGEDVQYVNVDTLLNKGSLIKYRQYQIKAVGTITLTTNAKFIAHTRQGSQTTQKLFDGDVFSFSLQDNDVIDCEVE